MDAAVDDDTTSTTSRTSRTARPCRTDARGLAVGTRSQAAVDHLEAALQAMLSYFGDPLAALDAATAEDPGWALPTTLKAGLLLTMGEHGPTLQARQLLRGGAEAAARGTERERAHAHAAAAAAAGDWEAACDAWEAILVRWPLDVAALLFAHLFDFYRGDALNLKRRPQRVLPHWADGLPLRGFVLGMLAFGLEESGHHAQAEDAGRAALAVNPRDPWAVHAVTHVFEMQGRHHDGARWLRSRHADWAVDNGFAFHQWFHAALFQMEALDTEGALATYDAHLAPATDMALQRVDGTAVLWRLKLLGVDVASRFDALRRTWSTQAPDAGFYAFNDLHALIALAGAGDVAALQSAGDSLLDALRSPASGGPTNRRMSAEVGLPLALAFTDHASGRWSDAARGLLRCRDRAHGFGGSHAQRDLLTLTLLDAAVRAGDRALARHVLHERFPAKAGTPLTALWLQRIGRLA
ncbi:tetratricopeptide repeat protein [Aquabacterium sp. J223]|uniref:tetratricopeptide repeat protein n=1 Tax=Aquabacterium sp. J223 TaxID=2898431 RepID=UPI0021ADBBAD|nr:tetratricopeptide repeat protein [Aquabacterium sp. J223]UUX97213.1 tetratricopeptide repeat protein [Aquabacterium sp. J223]